MLTKVEVKWEVRSLQISLSNRRVAFTCQSLQYSGQTSYKYPTSHSVSFSTGYKNYAEDVAGSWVAAQMNVTCKRGTGKWSFDVYNTVLNNVPDLGDLI